MDQNAQTEWIFKLRCNNGRIVTKTVVGFNDYETARNFAFTLVPRIAGPVTVESYM